jgi:hypothetical protein
VSRLRRTAGIGAVLLAAALGAAGCAAGPQPAGPTPSPISQLICKSDTARELAQVVGTNAARGTPTWSRADHVYSCDYRYGKGVMVLSVKELSSWNQTYAYYGRLARQLHKTGTIAGLGQAAFRAQDGSVVVRKDWKVLFADTSGMHGTVGTPGDSPAQLALDASAVILTCWAGD